MPSSLLLLRHTRVFLSLIGVLYGSLFVLFLSHYRRCETGVKLLIQLKNFSDLLEFTLSMLRPLITILLTVYRTPIDYLTMAKS